MTYPAAVLALSPLRYFRLGESSGTTAVDSSTNAVNATYSPGSGTWTGGTMGVVGANSTGTAVTFNGTSGKIDVGDLPADNAAAFSWVGWIKLTTGGSFKVIFSKYDSDPNRYEIELGSTGTFGNDLGLVVQNGDDGFKHSSAVLSTGVWQHLAVVYDGSQGTQSNRVKVYIDGVDSGITLNVNMAATLQALTTTNASIGARSTGALYWDGSMQDVSLHSNALSSGQVATLYAARDVGGAALASSGAKASAFGSATLSTFSGAALASFNAVAKAFGQATLTLGVAAALASSGSVASAFGQAALTTGIVSAVAVHSSGARVDVTFSSSVTLTASQVAITVNGYPVWASSVTGSGTSWSVFIGQRWIRAGDTVTLSYLGGAQIAATNSSITTQQQVRYSGRGFGMFLHFGLETWLDVEWATPGQSISVFNPTVNISQAIDQWVAAAKAAGMKYLVLTTKHHIGFCLWPTASTSYNISGTSWYSANGNPDIVRLFVNKVRAAGLGVGLYFSVWDRNHEFVNPSFNTASYTTLIQAQLAELLGNYGPIDLMWWDGYDWAAGGGLSASVLPYANCYTYAKGLQPNCQILINNHRRDMSKTDIDGYETPYEGLTPSSNLNPSESADTIRVDAQWFWKSSADAGVSAATINSTVATVNGRRASYLLNCPPDRSGKLPAGTIARLAEVGSGVLEQVNGSAATTTRTITITLTSDGTTPRASLTGLKCEFWNEPSPALHNTPSCIVLGATTNGSGVLSISVETTLGSGGVGYLLVTDTDGTTSQSPAAKAFSGPVTVT